ncbi:MAG: glycosyltransferase family 2 protein [Saprospiraceae bacterium]|nr:glycosyltransferase family 2 protein [Saprospiraceae bacterium]
MPSLNLKDLPPPPLGKLGFPWTEETPPQYISKNLPKISIITPSFNQGQFIEETIRSVLLQGYPNLEYIIIDGGSTDNTIEIIKKYSNFIDYWVSEKDKGQSNAINKGLKRATGDVFNWLNSDDFYLPNALITTGKAFRNKELNVFCGQLFTETKEGKRTHFKGVFLEKTIEKTIASRYFCQPPTFFRLSIVKKMGGVESQLYFCMDLELWINYLAYFGHKGIESSLEFLAVFRLHDAAKTHSSMDVMHTDHINLLLSIIDSSPLSTHFPRLFRQKSTIFTPYFQKNYPLSILDKKGLSIAVSESFLHYYAQYLSWQGFFELYFYTLKEQFLGRNKRVYLSPFIKLKRLFK